jgi:copper chaperone
MLAFEVKDMTCGHCVSAITRAVEAADPGARVQVDLVAHRVQIDPVSSGRARLAEAISAAGYTPEGSDGQGEVSEPAKKGGCCCR